MPDENQEATNEPSAESAALDTLAIESGVVDNTPEPEVKEAPAEDPKPEGKAEDKPEEKPETALEAVRKVMDKRREAAEPPKVEIDPDKKPVPDAENPAKAEFLSKAEWKDLDTRVKTRIGWLAGEVKREKAAAEALLPRAQMFDEMAGFVTNTGMSQDQFVEGLNIMGWLVTDPAKAYAALKPIFENLQGHMGELLPADLQEMVDDGRTTPELAKELAFNRSQRALLEDNRAKQVQYQDQLDEQRQATDKTTKDEADVKRILADWQGRQMASDPDFRLKAEQISDRAYVLVKMGTPANGGPMPHEQLLRILDQAKGEVDRRVAGQQIKRAKNPVTIPGAGGSINREPTTALEAVRIGLANMNR